MKLHKLHGNLSYLNEAIEAKRVSDDLKKLIHSKNWEMIAGKVMSV